MRSDRAGGQEQREGGEHGGGEHRLHDDAAGLPAELTREPRVGHRLDAMLGLARPARGKAHSGLATRLEDSKGAEREGDEDEQAGALGRAADDQRGREGDPHQ